jgi:hypothetical protein
VWRLWWLADEPFRLRLLCVGEHGGARVTDSLGGAVVDVSGSVQAQPAVAMFVVIPGEEGLAVPAGGLEGTHGRQVQKRGRRRYTLRSGKESASVNRRASMEFPFSGR